MKIRRVRTSEEFFRALKEGNTRILWDDLGLDLHPRNWASREHKVFNELMATYRRDQEDVRARILRVLAAREERRR